MPLRPFSPEAQRPAVLAKASWGGRINALGHVDRLSVLLRPERSQDPLRGERRFVQPDSHRIVNGIRNGRNGRGERAFAALLRAEWSLGIDTLHDDRLDLG